MQRKHSGPSGGLWVIGHGMPGCGLVTVSTVGCLRGPLPPSTHLIVVLLNQGIASLGHLSLTAGRNEHIECSEYVGVESRRHWVSCRTDHGKRRSGPRRVPEF
jgi:hypothetical protein